MERSQFKILVIDDEEALCEVLVESLELEDYSAKGTSSVDEFANNLDSLSEYQLIICDQNMPKLSGLELLKMVQDYFKETKPFFFLYTGNIPMSKDDFRALGGDEIVGKPFDMDELISMIDVYRQRLES